MSQDKVSISKPVLLNVFNKTLVHPLIMFGAVIAFWYHRSVGERSDFTVCLAASNYDHDVRG
jgi:hypothetical protein